MSYYRYEQERGELPYPIIYGGYGSGANAVQREYVKGEKPVEKPNKGAGTGSAGKRIAVEGMGEFRSIAAAARALEMPSSTLVWHLRHHNGIAKVKGREVRRVRL